MYFERNSYDPNTVSEAQSRLKSFQGATSISSSAYFGRDEEEELEASRAAGGGEGLAALESTARDMAQRFLSNPDVQNAADNIRAGALKVCVRLSGTLRLLHNRNLKLMKYLLNSSLNIWHSLENADNLLLRIAFRSYFYALGNRRPCYSNASS
jgi:hypothetical protein